MLLQKVDDASIKSFDDFSEGAMDLLSISVNSKSIVSNAAAVRLELSIIFVAYDCSSKEYFSARGMFSSRLFRDASATCNFSSFPTGISLSDSLGGENRKINLICFALTSGNIAFLWKARHIVANDRNRREMRGIITTTVLPETGVAWKRSICNLDTSEDKSSYS